MICLPVFGFSGLTTGRHPVTRRRTLRVPVHIPVFEGTFGELHNVAL